MASICAPVCSSGTYKTVRVVFDASTSLDMNACVCAMISVEPSPLRFDSRWTTEEYKPPMNCCNVCSDVELEPM